MKITFQIPERYLVDTWCVQIRILVLANVSLGALLGDGCLRVEETELVSWLEESKWVGRYEHRQAEILKRRRAGGV